MGSVENHMPVTQPELQRSARAALAAIRRSEQGASIIEMALVCMFLLLLIAGIVDLGGAFQNYIIITNSAREGARIASRLPCKDDNRVALRQAIVDATKNEAAGSNVVLADSNITIVPDPVANGCPAFGDPYRITVTIQYDTLLGSLWGMAQFPVSNSASMAFFGND